jgi:CubicO group peptidase (beta-lactamase class C family)
MRCISFAVLTATCLLPPGLLGQGAPARPPVGAWALTGDVAVVIGAAGGGATLRIGDGTVHALEPQGAEWSVPALGLALRASQVDGAAALELERYGHVVRLQPAGLPLRRAEAGDVPADFDDLVPRLMIALDVPGVSIALIRDGEIAWRGQYGVKESGRPERVDANTVFEAASMSKPAYAYPFLKLVERGAFELDTPLVHYLGGDYIEGEPLHRQITARMALTHTTGFPNWRRGGELSVGFTPGSRIGYSGEGFQFLQTAVEAVTGMDTDAFARQHLFGPLGMTSSSFVWQPRYEATYATGHTADGEPRERRPYASPNSAYTLYTTPADYARILIELMRRDRSAAHSLAQATIDAMLAAHETADGRSSINRAGIGPGTVHYGLGWRIDRTPDGDRFYHSGSNSTGFQCYVEFDPATGNGIVIMTNSSSGSPLWRAARAAIAF